MQFACDCSLKRVACLPPVCLREDPVGWNNPCPRCGVKWGRCSSTMAMQPLWLWHGISCLVFIKEGEEDE